MARQRKPTHPTSETRDDRHAAYAALTARLAACQSELSTQAKSRAVQEAPAATRAMAADLIGQMSRLMHRATEARGLPQLPTDRPVTLSELTIAFAQTRHALEAFGKRMGYDKPVADAEAQRRADDLRNEVARMINVRIILGIRTGYLVPTGNRYDAEKRELSEQFETIVDRLGLIVEAEALPDPDEKWF